jgi:hypothetical protein
MTYLRKKRRKNQEARKQAEGSHEGYQVDGGYEERKRLMRASRCLNNTKMGWRI